MKILNSKPIYEIFSQNKKNSQNSTKTKILIDYREKNSLVPSHLKKLNLEIEFRELKIGDYFVKNTIIERKTFADFLNSMINSHLLKQMEELKQFEKKLLIIEGIDENELYEEKNPRINPNAIRGFLLSIALKHKIPAIFTKNSEDTAKFICILSRKKENEKPLNGKKRSFNKKEQLQFIIESFSGIGPKTSKKLLKKFGTIQNIINAPEENLREILGKKTGIFLEIIGRKY